MEITKNIKDKAYDILRFEGVKNFPKQIGLSPFFLSNKDDSSIIAYGVIEFEGVEYKIGPQEE